jgi:hypothetical protein
MVLRLRIAPALWAKVNRHQPDFDRTVERFMRDGASWMFNSPELEVSNGFTRGRIRHTIVTEGYEFLLERPADKNADCNYDVIHVRPRESSKPSELVQSARIIDQITVYKPDNAPRVPEGVDPLILHLTRPDQHGVRQEFAFIIKIKNYKPLAPHLKAPINLAWKRIKEGRTVQRVFWEDDVIFLITQNPTAKHASTLEDETNLRDALESVDAGRIITDPYELKKIREMAAKFGEMVSGLGTTP